MRAALAMVLVLVLAGCGDDSLSRGEWSARANAICLETLKKVEALGRPSTSGDYLRVTPKANELARDGDRAAARAEGAGRDRGETRTR